MVEQAADDFRLEHRLGLSISEAASVIGVAENTLRSILPEIPHFHVGRRVVIPVEPFKDWLATEAKSERNRVDATVEEILDSLE